MTVQPDRRLSSRQAEVNIAGPGHASAMPSRRELLRVGSLGLAGITLPKILSAEETRGATGITPKADACIVIYLNGGPSHLDMWDMKPEAPVEIRGEFQSISTTVPGVQLSEHLPKLARQMHHAALIRSMHHNVNNSHALAVYTAMTGHDKGDANVIVANSGGDHPTPGSILTKLRPPKAGTVPYVCLPYKTKEGAGGPPQPGFFGGFIGQGYDPFWVLEDPNMPQFNVPSLSLHEAMSPARLDARNGLLAHLDGRMRATRGEPSVAAMNQFQQRALDLLTSHSAQQAFRIQEESDAVRDAYGRNIYGQSVLLARRLVETGTRVVNVSWAPDANATWDTHGNNFSTLKNTLLPQFDAACSALLADLEASGRLERTLVAVMGDFGRSPRVNANAGRDHWNSCYTIMMAGGGIKGGAVFGASDRIGAKPAERPVSPGDAVATIYQLLGIDYRRDIHDQLGRPLRIIPQGDVIRDILA